MPLQSLKIRRQDGMSLVSVMVALAVVGVLAMVAMQFASNSIKSAKAIERLGEQEDIRRLIRSRMDCAATKLKIGGGRNIVFYGRDGQPIAPVNANTNEMAIGGWKFTATAYNATTGEFSVNARDEHQASEKLFKTVPLVCTP